MEEKLISRVRTLMMFSVHFLTENIIKHLTKPEIIKHADDQNKMIRIISEETKTLHLLEKDFELIILNVLKDLKQRMDKELKLESDTGI